MFRSVLFVAILISTAGYAETFRFSLLSEPMGLDPQTTSANSGNYLFHNIYRGLYRFHSKRGLIYEGAERCFRLKLTLFCRLSAKHRWSNGEQIVAEDYVRSFRRLSDPDSKSPQTESVLTLKNAKAILAGKMKPESLGVVAVDRKTLRFDFAEDDTEFEYKLTNVATAPWPKMEVTGRENASDFIASGPYMIREWKKGTSVKLSPNPHYGLKRAVKSPDLEAYFIDSDATALRMYEAGKLDFLRRLMATEVARFKKSPEYHEIPMSRFDYIGFGAPLDTELNLREALARSIDFETFKAILDNGGLPGCPSLVKRLMDRQPCVEFNPVAANAALAKAGPVPKLKFHFSRMGGEDIAQTVEWIQGQWKKHLEIHVELIGEEQGIYLKHLKAKPPTIFRKGVSLDRPTCLAALEIFKRGNAENYLRIDDDKYELLVKNLSRAKGESARKVACRTAIDHLLKTYRLIPLGEMFFNILAKGSFKGWDLNELNQLDLTELEVSSPGL